MSTQASLIPLCEERKKLLTALMAQLRSGQWQKRNNLAFLLHTNIRAIRDAASHSRGEILSGNRGLKLTACATEEEYLHATGRFRSQMREMSRRLREIEDAWVARERFTA